MKNPTTTKLIALLLVMGGVAPHGACWAAPQPATIKIREYLNRDWPRTLLTYELRDDMSVPFITGMAARAVIPLSREMLAGELRLVDIASGQEIPCQLSRVVYGKKPFMGRAPLLSARLSFFAALPAGGELHYELRQEAPASAQSRMVRSDSDALTLDNGVVAVRLPPVGSFRFAAPVALESGAAQGPIRGLRLSDGRWVGGSWFEAANPSGAPQLTGSECSVAEAGSLFAEATVRYTFTNNGWYQATIRILAGDLALRIDEQFDLGEPGEMLDYRLSVSLGSGWQPDTAYFFIPGKKETTPQFGAFLAARGMTNLTSHGSMTLPMARGGTLFPVAVRYPWYPNAHWFALADVAPAMAMAASGLPPFVGVVPLHAGNWRGATDNSDGRLRALDNGDMRLEWRLRASPHPRSLLHTGEYDPDLPLTFCRRQWALIGGALQSPSALHAMRATEGFVNLDDYKDWQLDWPAGPAVTYPRLVCGREGIARLKARLAAMPGGEALQRFIYFNDTEARRAELWGLLTADFEWGSPYGQARYILGKGDPPEMPWASHYRQSQMANWAGNVDELLSSEGITGEQRQRLRRDVAAVCYALTEPDTNPRGAMTHLGNPNMPVNRFMALAFAAALIPDHPMAPTWLDLSARYVRYKLAMNTAPGGVWSELITYFGACVPHIMQATAVLAANGRSDASLAMLSALPADFTLKLLTPPDPRFGGARELPNWGHEGSDTLTHWLLAAANLRPFDEARARDFAWAWERQGRPMNQHHDAGFSERMLAHADLLDGLSPGYVPPSMASAWMPGFGAVLRAHAGTPEEVFFSLRQGYMVSHSDPNQGDFVLYAKGAPLVALSLHAYPLVQVPAIAELDKTFGWHSRVRFGAPGNGGGWPGGGAMGGVPAYDFTPALDYLRAEGDYPPQSWTRQVLFAKGRRQGEADYFLVRDSFAPVGGAGAVDMQPKWWGLRTPGPKAMITADSGSLRYRSGYGAQLEVRMLQPEGVPLQTRDVTYELPLYFGSARMWLRGHDAAGQRGNDDNVTAEETTSVHSFGPVAPGLDIVATFVPLGEGESAPQFEVVADGVVRVASSVGVDYLFLDRKPISYSDGDVAFSGLAGAVRIFNDEVHLVISEGPGMARYKASVLRSDAAAIKVIPGGDIDRKRTIEENMAAAPFAAAPLPEGCRVSGHIRCAVTLTPEGISGQSHGRGGFLYAPMPPELRVLPMLVVDGQTYAAGTSGNQLIIPLMPGHHTFEVRALPQPPVFRNWQAW